MKSPIPLKDQPTYTIAWTRWEHQSPVAKVYSHIAESQIKFVTDSLTSGKNGQVEILYVEKN